MGPPPRDTTKSGSWPCSAARFRARRTQAIRARSTGLYTCLAITSLRAAHSVDGRIQEFGFASAGTSAFHAPGPPQSCQPAPADDSREEGCESSTVNVAPAGPLYPAGEDARGPRSLLRRFEAPLADALAQTTAANVG